MARRSRVRNEIETDPAVIYTFQSIVDAVAQLQDALLKMQLKMERTETTMSDVVCTLKQQGPLVENMNSRINALERSLSVGLGFDAASRPIPQGVAGDYIGTYPSYTRSSPTSDPLTSETVQQPAFPTSSFRNSYIPPSTATLTTPSTYSVASSVYPTSSPNTVSYPGVLILPACQYFNPSAMPSFPPKPAAFEPSSHPTNHPPPFFPSPIQNSYSNFEFPKPSLSARLVKLRKRKRSYDSGFRECHTIPEHSKTENQASRMRSSKSRHSVATSTPLSNPSSDIIACLSHSPDKQRQRLQRGIDQSNAEVHEVSSFHERRSIAPARRTGRYSSSSSIRRVVIPLPSRTPDCLRAKASSQSSSRVDLTASRQSASNSSLSDASSAHTGSNVVLKSTSENSCSKRQQTMAPIVKSSYSNVRSVSHSVSQRKHDSSTETLSAIEKNSQADASSGYGCLNVNVSSRSKKICTRGQQTLAPGLKSTFSTIPPFLELPERHVPVTKRLERNEKTSQSGYSSACLNVDIMSPLRKSSNQAPFNVKPSHSDVLPQARSCSESQKWFVAAPKRSSILGKNLLNAAQEGRAGAVRNLLKEGADVNYVHGSEWTPLHRAAAKGHADVVSLLLKSGAYINAKVSGFSALHIAAYDDSSGRCVAQLIDAGADPNCKNSLGRTPLHYAVESGNETSVRSLLDAGAFKNVRDKEGKAPIDFAKSHCIRRLLAPYQSKIYVPR